MAQEYLVSDRSNCLGRKSHTSVTVPAIKHHDHSNLQKKEFTGLRAQRVTLHDGGVKAGSRELENLLTS